MIWLGGKTPMCLDYCLYLVVGMIVSEGLLFDNKIGLYIFLQVIWYEMRKNAICLFIIHHNLI